MIDAIYARKSAPSILGAKRRTRKWQRINSTLGSTRRGRR